MADGPEIEELQPERRRPPAHPSAPLDARAPRQAHVAAARVDTVPRWLAPAVASLAALVLLSIAKPWAPPVPPATAPAPARVQALADGSGQPIAPSLAGLTQGVAAPQPPGTADCGAPDGWRLVVVGALAGRPSRAQSAVEPAARPAGPTDPSIPAVAAGEGPVEAIGACAPTALPATADGQVPAASVRVVAAWRLVPAGPRPVHVEPLGATLSTAPWAPLYAPSGLAGIGWGPGRYVVELDGGGPATEAWVGFDVTPPPTVRAGGAAGPTPVPSVTR